MAISFMGWIDRIVETPRLREQLDKASKETTEYNIKELRKLWTHRHDNGVMKHKVKHLISMIRVLRKPIGGY